MAERGQDRRTDIGDDDITAGNRQSAALAKGIVHTIAPPLLKLKHIFVLLTVQSGSSMNRWLIAASLSCWTGQAAHAFVPSSTRRSSMSVHPPATTLPPSTTTSQLKAKTSKKKKTKKSSGGGGGLKGFGAGPSKSKGGVETDRSKPARDFYDFLEQGGAGDNLSRCGLGYFPLDDDIKLRGIVALKDIKQGDNLIRIPYELAVNLGPEGTDTSLPAVTLLRDYCEVMGPSNQEKSKDPKYAYYSMLPPFRGDDCLGSTDFFSQEALDALQAPLVVEETLLRQKLSQARFDRDIADESSSFPSWIDGSPVTEEHLRWAVWLITSRVLTVQGDADEGKSYRLLIPFLDMCNHDRASSHVLTGRAVPGGELKVVAGSPVKEGSAINICYGGGQAGNDRFIQDYGFLDTSENNRAFTMVAQQIMGKRRLMEGAGSGRFMSAPDKELNLKALRSTSIEEDEQLLAASTQPDLRAAYQYRLGVKKALSKFIDIE